MAGSAAGRAPVTPLAAHRSPRSLRTGHLAHCAPTPPPSR